MLTIHGQKRLDPFQAPAGGRYDPTLDTWLPMNLTDGPYGLQNPRPMVATGNGMIAWGGGSNTGAVYCGCDAQLQTPSVEYIPGLLAPRISWNIVAAATHYDVVRGLVSILRSTGGDFTASTEDCVAPERFATWFEDTDEPAVGDAYWYLVRSANLTEDGSWESNGAAQVGARDPEIEASPVACP